MGGVRWHGGHVGGQVASQLAVRTIEQTLRSGQAPGGDDLDILVTAIKNANFAIFNQARSDPSLHNMGDGCRDPARRGDRSPLPRGR